MKFKVPNNEELIDLLYKVEDSIFDAESAIDKIHKELKVLRIKLQINEKKIK